MARPGNGLGARLCGAPQGTPCLPVALGTLALDNLRVAAPGCAPIRYTKITMCAVTDLLDLARSLKSTHKQHGASRNSPSFLKKPLDNRWRVVV